MDISQIELIGKYADIFQVGARNMQNFTLLRELGHARKPVLLKRGISATIEEWLLSAEYILAGGNNDVILCERGIRTFETATRNTFDISAIPVVKKLSHLPIVADPSHGAGRRDMVAPMARAAVAAGADGLIIEVHNDPDHALQRRRAVDVPGAVRPADGRAAHHRAGDRPQHLPRAAGRAAGGSAEDVPAMTGRRAAVSAHRDRRHRPDRRVDCARRARALAGGAPWCGVDRPAVLAHAIGSGAIDRGRGVDVPSSTAADLVVLAAPVRQNARLLDRTAGADASSARSSPTSAAPSATSSTRRGGCRPARRSSAATRSAAPSAAASASRGPICSRAGPGFSRRHVGDRRRGAGRAAAVRRRPRRAARR